MISSSSAICQEELVNTTERVEFSCLASQKLLLRIIPHFAVNVIKQRIGEWGDYLLEQTRRQPAFPDDDWDDGDGDDEDDDYKSCSFALIPSGKRLSQNFISFRLTLINDCFNSLTHTHTHIHEDPTWLCVCCIDLRRRRIPGHIIMLAQQQFPHRTEAHIAPSPSPNPDPVERAKLPGTTIVVNVVGC